MKDPIDKPFPHNILRQKENKMASICNCKSCYQTDEWQNALKTVRDLNLKFNETVIETMKEVKMTEQSPEFKWWYERVFCQSPSKCKLQYDDEKMWEAWKAGYDLAYRQGVVKGMELKDETN